MLLLDRIIFRLGCNAHDSNHDALGISAGRHRDDTAASELEVEEQDDEEEAGNDESEEGSGSTVLGQASTVAMTLKLGLHISTVLAVHWINLSVPNFDCGAPSGCSRNISLQVFYAICAVYMSLSAMQIADGFPRLQYGLKLYASTAAVPTYMFKAYMAAPFLWELRNVVDWTTSCTSLDLFQWLKMEDIAATCFVTQVDMQKRVAYVKGAARSTVEKMTMGVGFLVVLLVVVLGPLLLFSSVSGVFDGVDPRTIQQEWMLIPLFRHAHECIQCCLAWLVHNAPASPPTLLYQCH